MLSKTTYLQPKNYDKVEWNFYSVFDTLKFLALYLTHLDTYYLPKDGLAVISVDKTDKSVI